jgi:hypothetical protein
LEGLRKGYFGPDVFSDILGKLKKEEPPFIVAVGKLKKKEEEPPSIGAVQNFLPADLDPLAPEVGWSEFIRKRYVPWKVLDVGERTFIVYKREDHVPRKLP